MTSYKISVKMGEEDMPDLDSLRFSIGKVLVYIALRIHDDCRFAFPVTYQIGSVCETS